MRQSFWLTSRLVPSLTTSAESPPGPSVIDVSTWIATVRPPPRSSSSPSTVRMKFGEAERRAAVRSSSRRRVAGHSTAMSRRQVVAQPRLVEVVAVEVGDVEVVGALDPRRAGRRRAGRCAGTTNHEPKNAGTNHGSHRIEPCAVSMRMPAWPSEVARIIGGTLPSGAGAPHRPVRRRAGRCTAGRRARRARSTPCRPSSAARSDRPGRRTSRPGTDGVGRRRRPAAPSRSTTSRDSEPPRPTRPALRRSPCRRGAPAGAVGVGSRDVDVGAVDVRSRRSPASAARRRRRQQLGGRVGGRRRRSACRSCRRRSASAPSSADASASAAVARRR